MLDLDCLPLLLKLKQAHAPQPRSALGMITEEILSFSKRFTFVFGNHVPSAENRVVHSLAYLQFYDPSKRIWLEEGLQSILSLTQDDMYVFFNGIK